MPSFDPKNTRVNGVVADLLSGHFSPKQPPMGFMAHAESPTSGFDPFMMGPDTYVRFIGSPDDIGDWSISQAIKPLWRNALGVTMVANPKLDAVSFTFHHSANRNGWSPWNRVGVTRDFSWHGLGGLMAFAARNPDPLDWEHFKRSFGLKNVSFDDLSPEQRANANLLGALAAVAGKGEAMATKWEFIGEGAENVRKNTGLALPQNPGLGGMKTIGLYGPSLEAKAAGIRMTAAATGLAGWYISGGDEGTSRGDWTNIFAQVAPYNMAGANNAAWEIQGRVPNDYTGDGVYEGIKTVQSLDSSLKGAPVLFQGYGGVGIRVVKRAAQDGQKIAAITDINPEALLSAAADLKETGYADVNKVVLIWDRSSAKGHPDFARWSQLVQSNSRIQAVDGGLAGAITLAHKKRSESISLVSPNATSHPITFEVLEAMKKAGTQAVLGGANNMLALDAHGSYMPVGRRAVDYGIFIPNDSAINRMGATIVLYNAIGLNETNVPQLVEQVGLRVADEYTNAFKRGLVSQQYSDAFARSRHNEAIRVGESVGGFYEDTTVTPPPVRGGGGGGGLGEESHTLGAGRLLRAGGPVMRSPAMRLARLI